MVSPISKVCAERLWMACVAPELVTVGDVDTILFGGAETERYSSSIRPGDMMIADTKMKREQKEVACTPIIYNRNPVDYSPTNIQPRSHNNDLESEVEGSAPEEDNVILIIDAERTTTILTL
ncbi:hypothetical protein R1flu_010841 [Riccia fluitans]|uniref:Uncharacterized protein n=1 Tax=Riccia fluitans TaxID=41844 RepID=A0ABD1Z769_9MARC